MVHSANIDLQDVYEAQKYVFETNYAYWIEHVLFSFNWWLLLIIAIVPWFIWWRYVDKERIIEISLIGLLSMVIVTGLDIIGTSFAFWTYGFKVVQMLTTMSAIDMTLLPVLNMFLYQLFPKWKSYMIASIVLALIGTFIVEPLFAWGDIYILHEWKYIYSFPIYITFTAFLKWFVDKIKFYEEKMKKKI
ncbi:MAG TPA: CBO0543 family protein [Pseudogracilibacillus sp.]|nr:CBO0543 family protein [Pseudogracilibacillus sp.]